MTPLKYYEDEGRASLNNDHTLYAKQIYMKVKSELLSMKIKEGDFLTLSVLANRYNVSKTPIRDALNMLEMEGYLASIPRKGYLVRIVRRKEIEEALQLRSILEKSALLLALEHSDKTEMKELLVIADRHIESINNTYHSEQLQNWNHEFHKQLIQCSLNSLLIQTWINTDEILSFYLLEDSNHLDWNESLQEHKDIASAIVAGEKRKAGSLLNKHLQHTEYRVINRL